MGPALVSMKEKAGLGSWRVMEDGDRFQDCQWICWAESQSRVQSVPIIVVSSNCRVIEGQSLYRVGRL